MTFDQLPLTAPFLRALEEEKYTHPTPIQEQAIPVILEGRDMIGCAQTGTGKTAAFSIPMLQLLNTIAPGKGRRPIRGLVVTPTRELAMQIKESLDAYGRHCSLRNTVVFGGVSQHGQVNALHRGVDILVATPGRLLDLFQQGYVKLDQLSFFVLDEADRMLDMGFLPDMKRIIKLLPAKRQSLFFSATMPDNIRQLANTIVHDPAFISVTPAMSTAERVEQSVYFIEHPDKKYLLLHLLREGNVRSALVFTKTKHGADKVSRMLSKAHIHAEAIHGNKSQSARQKALKNFKEGITRVLVATDIAARGIDIDNLELVVNYDIPNIPETYVHRIGRTGRAGASGEAVSFCSGSEKSFWRDILKTIPVEVPVKDASAFRNAAAEEKKADTGNEPNYKKKVEKLLQEEAPSEEKKGKRRNRNRNRNKFRQGASRNKQRDSR